MLRPIAIPLLAAGLAAQSAPRLLVDVNTEPYMLSSSSPDKFARFGAWTFFAADDGIHGRELFRTNGSPIATALFADLRPGSAGSAPSDLVQVGTRLFFTADDGVHGRELWVSDGTVSGTRMVVDLEVGPASSRMNDLRALNARFLLFSATFGTSSRLWSIDASTLTMETIVDPAVTGESLLIRDAVTMSDSSGTYLWYLVARPSLDVALMKTDGTRAGSRALVARTEWFTSRPRYMQAGAGHVLISTWGGTWISDGTAPGTWLTSIPMAQGTGAIVFDGRTWIRTYGDDLCWVTDGTPAGATPIPRPASVPTWLLYSIPGVIGGSLYLHVGPPHGGSMHRLFRVDPGSTALVDLGEVPAMGQSTTAPWVRVGTSWLAWTYADLIAFDPILLTTTTLASRDVVPPPSTLLPSNGRVFFAMNDPALGTEPGVSDGTRAGTVLLRDINSLPNRTFDSSPRSFVRFERNTVFVARVATRDIDRTELWISDGTTTGTRRLATVNSRGARIRPLEVIGGLLYFERSERNVASLWRTDGTVAGTVGVPDPVGRRIESVFGVGGRLVIIAASTSADVIDRECLFGDGTSWVPLGAVPMYTRVSASTRLGDRWYFRIDGSWLPRDIWNTDGTASGTNRMAVGRYPSIATELVAWRDRVWYLAESTGGFQELWSMDGTGTNVRLEVRTRLAWYPFRTLLATGTHLYLLSIRDLIVTDGTPAGTIQLPAQINGSGGYDTKPAVAVLGDRVVFDSFATPVRPWVTDGTVAGTRLLLADADRTGLEVLEYADIGNGRAMFGAFDANTREVWNTWVTDGTASGSRVISSSIPFGWRSPWFFRSNYGMRNGQLFLELGDPIVGLEPHVMDLGATVERLSESCGSVGRRAVLGASLGGSPNGGLTIEGRSSAGSIAQLVLSPPPLRSTPFPRAGACTIDVDLNAWVLLATLPITNGVFAQTWPLPDDPALYGIQAVVQGFVGPTNAPLGVDFTNGLLLQLGR